MRHDKAPEGKYPPALVHALARECKLNVHKTYTQKRNGYNRAGYKDGYRNLAVREVLTHTPVQRKYTNPLGGPLITLFTEAPLNVSPPDSV